MEHGLVALLMFLVGLSLSSHIWVFIYDKKISQLKQAIDESHMKLDCIAEWLIDQDQDPEELDYAGIDDPNSTDLLVEMFLTEEDRVSLLEEDSCNE